MAGHTLAGHAPVMRAGDALQLLKEGNQRFVLGLSAHPNLAQERRGAVAHAQDPFAIILGCADSRVSPELIFDRGIGDLFVVRVAGSIFDDASLGSIEYGVKYLGIPLVVVLGHERCGGIEAAIKAVRTGARFGGRIETLIKTIRPAIEQLDALPPEELLEAAMRANVALTVARLKAARPILTSYLAQAQLHIVGARFDLDDGIVDFSIA